MSENGKTQQRSYRTLPEHWGTALVKAGFKTAGGRANALAFTRALQEHAGQDGWPSQNTVLDVMYVRRKTRPNPKLVALMAEVLGVDRDTVDGWANPSLRGSAPWVPPPASVLLTGKQRRVLDQLVEVMVAGANGDGEGGGGGGDTAPMNVADGQLETTSERRQDGTLRVSTNVRPIRGDGQPRTSGSGGARKRQRVTDGDGGDDT